MSPKTSIALGVVAAFVTMSWVHQHSTGADGEQSPVVFPTGLNIPIPGGRVVIGSPDDTAAPILRTTVPVAITPPSLPRLPHIIVTPVGG